MNLYLKVSKRQFDYFLIVWMKLGLWFYNEDGGSTYFLE